MATYLSSDIPEHLLAKNQQSTKENVSLFKSALAGSVFGVTHALEQGAKPDYFFNPEDSKNALHVASENGHEEIVQELLNHGATVDCHVLGSKETALMLALANKHNNIAKLLLKTGASVNIENSYGNSPLNITIRTENEEMFNILLEYGADAAHINHKGSTPLHLVCYSELGPAELLIRILRVLISRGAPVNHPDHRGMTPFLVCCASGRADLMNVLLEEGADSTARNTSNESAKDIAQFYGHIEIALRFSMDGPNGRFA